MCIQHILDVWRYHRRRSANRKLPRTGVDRWVVSAARASGFAPCESSQARDNSDRSKDRVCRRQSKLPRMNQPILNLKGSSCFEKLSTEKKDPTEILEAYNSTHLVLSGNSSHLMPWYTKLGFTEGPCISTLHSLTCDGGVVVALDFVIIKVRVFKILVHLCSDGYTCVL